MPIVFDYYFNLKDYKKITSLIINKKINPDS